MNKKAFSLIELSVVLLIIGLIIAAVVSYNAIYSKTIIVSARTITQSSEINSIKNLEIWLETSMEESFDYKDIDNQSLITNWYDISNKVNKIHAIQSTSSNKPTFSNSINEIHAISFDGNNDYMEINASFLNKSEYSIFIVDKRISDKSNNYYIGDSTNVTENEELILGYSNETSVIHSHSGENYYNSSISEFSGGNSEAKIFGFINKNNVGKKTYINGILAATSNDTNNLNNISNLKIGNLYEGEIGEIIIFSRALNNQEREDIEKYLSNKWKITNFTSQECLSGSVSSSGCDAITSCPVSLTGSNISSVSDASGTISCNQPDYYGTVNYTCSEGTINITGSCSQDCTVSITGINSPSSVTSGNSGSLTCNADGYSGTVNYTCSVGEINTTGNCLQDCTVSITGIDSPSSITSGVSGSLTCNADGYSGSVSYNCSDGNLNASGTCNTNGWVVYSTTGCRGGGGDWLPSGQTITCNADNNGRRAWAQPGVSGPSTNSWTAAGNKQIYYWLESLCTEDGPGGSVVCEGDPPGKCLNGHNATIYECNHN